MLKKTYRHKILILGILGLMGLNYSLIFATAHRNAPKGCYNETHRGEYTFTDHKHKIEWTKTTFGKYNSYGPHDWIADSAIRLILMSGTYKNYVNWLFPSSSNSKCQVDLGNLGGKVTITQESWQNGDLRYYEYFANVKGWDDLTWKKLRRFVSFLHGTKAPDDVESKNYYIQDEWAPPEEEGMITAKWADTSTKVYHHINFEFKDGDGELQIQSGRNAQDKVEDASKQAIELLKEQPTVLEDNEETNVDGYFELAAYCLGGIAHYIGDVSHPGHVMDDYGDPHDSWDYYIASVCEFSSSDNGKPDWSECNPSSLVNKLKETLSPKECAKCMAMETYAGVDLYGKMDEKDWTDRDLACGNGIFPKKYDDNTPAKYETRMKTLACRAILYTACAMLNTIKKAGWHDKTDNDVIMPASGAVAVQEVTDQVEDRATSEDLSSAEEEEKNNSARQTSLDEFKSNSQLWLVLSITGISTVVIPWLIQERIRSRVGSETSAAS